MSVTDAAAQLVATLRDAGIRVAERAGDITPPVCYVQIGNFGEAGTTLSGNTLTTFWLYYIPIRGVDNIGADAAALDAIYDALSPIHWGDFTGTRSSVTVGPDTWPCYRIDVILAGLPAAERTKADAY